ncbi:MAG: hypothetical protein NZM04_09505 [Methylacidiphilales bacterium]|nr:hypothetical protein [Candidatus Methylacidiphilales bacterium]MDW8348766.1 hypothetical protein [Verrucomicrobiae bacterium]
MTKTKSPIGLSTPPEDLIPEKNTPPASSNEPPHPDAYTAEEIDLRLQETDEEVQNLIRDKNLIDRRLSEAERRQRELNELRKKHYEFRDKFQKINEKLLRDIVKVEARAQELDNERETINIILRNYEQQKQNLDSIDEKTWSAENLRDELNRAMAIIEEAQAVCANADAQIQAWQRTHSYSTHSPQERTQPQVPARPFSFLHYCLMGFAYSLPLIITLLIIAVIFLTK